MIIDVHCHYTFTRQRPEAGERFSFEPAPAEHDTAAPLRPTDFDSYVSSRATARVSWRLVRWWLGYPPPGADLDRRLAAGYQRHLLVADGPVERFVLLAFDAVHDDDGHCVGVPQRPGVLGSDIYTANTLIRERCRAQPGRFLFGASVHPYRADAPACVEEVFAAGACLLKWLPLHQNIAPSDPRTIAVLRKCAALGLPVLLHAGDEFSLATQRPAYRPVGPWLQALRALRADGSMPPVIFAHVATPVMPWGDRASHRLLIDALLGEFADAPLYADLSALGAWTKVGYLRRLARRPELHGKLLFGSDFPVPTGLWGIRRELGRDYPRLAAMESWPQQAAAAYRRLGFDEIVFHRAAELLPNVDHFAATAVTATA